MKINDLFSVKDKIVMITGSTRGIGRAIAEGFIANGAKVIIHGSSEEKAKKVCQEINAYDFIGASFLNMDEVHEMSNKLKNKFDKIDVLINNAGFEEHFTIDKMKIEMLDDIYNVNTKAHYILTSNLIDLLKKSDYPSIINVTSIHQLIPVRENSPYCMAKAALDMFTKVGALEFGSLGIRVNNLAPGAIATEMNENLLDDLEKETGVSFGQWVPLGRVGDKDEMVGPAIYLASKASSYMTGATLFVDGGYKENLLRY
ncbi:MAG: SDR family NAD(P)-dependent oxidoreductase [Lachnospirales bacterium]